MRDLERIGQVDKNIFCFFEIDCPQPDEHCPEMDGWFSSPASKQLIFNHLPTGTQVG
jgi:hypothetical protein